MYNAMEDEKFRSSRTLSLVFTLNPLFLTIYHEWIIYLKFILDSYFQRFRDDVIRSLDFKNSKSLITVMKLNQLT